MLEKSDFSISFWMSCTSADTLLYLHLIFFIYLFAFLLFLSTHLQVDNTWICCSVFMISKSTLTGIPLPKNSNRVAIQFGASTWVNSMKPTKAKLYHSLGDGGMNENSWICTKVWTHDTGALLFRQTRAVKRNQNEISPFWRCNTDLASIYRPIYSGGGGGEGRGLEYFIVRRGGSGYSLSLAFRILRVHICQLSSRKYQIKRAKSNWALWSKAW